ncbi:MAG: hypothetical protein WCY25_04395 [Moheibacter sp.]
MKNNFYLNMLLAIAFSISLGSCFGSDDDDSNDDDNNNGTSQVVVAGSWKVTLFEEDNSNQTHHFTGYSFSFNTDHTLVATNGSVTQTGTWSTGGDDSSNKLIINFSVADGPFEEISEDWNIQSKTPSKIELRHVSGGDGSVDFLTFEKI